jgi:hypothetical protein
MHRAFRVLVLTITGLVLLGIVLVLAADPILTFAARRGLGSLESYRGELEHAHLDLGGPTVELTGVRLYDRHAPGSAPPAIVVPRLRAELSYRSLLGTPRVRLIVDAPRAVLPAEPAEPERKPSPPVAQTLEQSRPAIIEELVVNRASVTLRRGPAPTARDLRLEGVDLDVRDVATRASLVDGRPVTGKITGTLQGSGRIDATLTADLFSSPAKGTVRGGVTGLAVRDALLLGINGPAGLSPGGRLDLALDLALGHGRLTGKVAPRIEGFEAPAAAKRVLDLVGSAASSGLAGDVGRRLGAVADKAKPLAGGRATGAASVPVDLPVHSGPGALRDVIVALVRQGLTAGLRLGLERGGGALGERTGLRNLGQGLEGLLPDQPKSESAGAKP